MARPPRAALTRITLALLLLFLLLTPGVIELTRDSRLDQILDDFHERHDRVLVAAHRGAHQRHPENSLSSIEEAVRLGVDIVELDVQLTKDGVFVLMHDHDVKRTTTGRGRVSRMKLSKLRRLYLVGADGEPTRERVPTLEEALAVADDRILVDVDFKAGRAPETLVRTLESVDAVDEVFVFSPDIDLLSKIHRINPAIRMMPRVHSERNLDSLLNRFEVPIVHIDGGFSSDAIASITRKKARTWMNLLGAPDRAASRGDFSAWSRIAQRGANVLQTDHPGLLLSFLLENDLR